MDWQGRYERFIYNRRHTYPFGSTERHHILPRSMGGTDEWDNLVRLSAKDHRHAHLLLYMMGHKEQMFAVVLICQRHGLKITRFIRRAYNREQQRAFREANRQKSAERAL